MQAITGALGQAVVPDHCCPETERIFLRCDSPHQVLLLFQGGIFFFKVAQNDVRTLLGLLGY